LVFRYMKKFVEPAELKNVVIYNDITHHIRYSPIRAHEICQLDEINQLSIVLFIANFTI